MASSLYKLLSTLLLLSTILDFLPTTTSQECPYPCYPPPTGPGNGPPATTTPPVSTTPPAALFTPPAGYYPFTPPSPYFSGVTPPPPEPIVPWFPYYYRKPPHQDQSSSSPAIRGSRNVALFMFMFIASYFLLY